MQLEGGKGDVGKGLVAHASDKVRAAMRACVGCGGRADCRHRKGLRSRPGSVPLRALGVSLNRPRIAPVSQLTGAAMAHRVPETADLVHQENFVRATCIHATDPTLDSTARQSSNIGKT